MGLQATHLRMRRCNLKSSQLLLLLAHLSPPGAGVQVWGGGRGVVSEQAQQPGGRQAGTPTHLELPTPSRARGRDTSGSVDSPQPLPELAPHPEQSKGVRKGPKENRGTKAAEQPLKHTEPHLWGSAHLTSQAVSSTSRNSALLGRDREHPG